MLAGTPRGFRDVLPAEALRRERLADRVREVFAEAGYLPVETPLLESREVLERGGRLKGVPFQLFDTDDRLLMLRPELTLPIARLVAARMDPAAEPLRLRYQAPVVREQAMGHGQERQFTQMGVELIGGEDEACEVEVMNLLARTLETLEVRDWTLCVSSVRPLQALLASPEVGEALAARILDLVHTSDLVGVDELLNANLRHFDAGDVVAPSFANGADVTGAAIPPSPQAPLRGTSACGGTELEGPVDVPRRGVCGVRSMVGDGSFSAGLEGPADVARDRSCGGRSMVGDGSFSAGLDGSADVTRDRSCGGKRLTGDGSFSASGLSRELAEAIRGACRLHGGPEVLDELERLVVAAGVSADAAGLGELKGIVSHLGEGARSHLTIDCSLSGRFDYYTGVIFRAYAPGLPGSLASGGRYDAVLANLDVAAVGAAGFALSLERLLDVVEAQGKERGRRHLRIAVPKGSLFRGSLAALAGAGLDVAELADPGRHLMLTSGDVDFIIVRASDAPAFVAYGGADCGLCGSDSLEEADLELLILRDLLFGACRFVVAAPRATADAVHAAIATGEPLKVASKYPRIAEGFFERRGVPAEVVELHGNIELAPMVGMADCIVDITATGTTLRENDLVVVDEVETCSARLFASPAAYRSDARVRALADAIAQGN